MAVFRSFFQMASAVVLVLLLTGCPSTSESRSSDGAHQSTVGSSPDSAKASNQSSAAGCPIRLRDVTDKTGIQFVHTDGSSGRRYIVEPMSAGVATFDYDGDGWIDIYFPNGAPLLGHEEVDVAPRHALYRNMGDWTFQDVTEQAGIDCTEFGLGVAVGDFDNDGAPDIFLDNYGPNVLLHNNGDGTFSRVTEQVGIVPGDLVGAGACFLDIDADGNLDLYVGNYIRLNCAEHVPRIINDIPSYPSPRDYEPMPDELYRNNGDGTFSDVSEPSGIAAVAGRSMGMTCADYDNDGDTDVFICNDVQPNFLFQNDGHGVFQEVAPLAGTACNAVGRALANMGVDAGDYDNDGWIDFFTTNYQGTLPVLFHNLGDGLLNDETVLANAGAGCYFHVNWGCSFVDFDNDGHRDLFIGNGHTEDNIELRDSTATYHAHYIVLRNEGGRFANVSDQCSDGPRRQCAAKGVAADDLDNDGDVDLVVLASRERPMVLRNMYMESNPKHHWLQIRLVGVSSNRDAIGARVVVSTGDLTQTDEVHSGRGYQSHSGMRLQFGLGTHSRIDRMEIRWPGGTVDVVENVATDRFMTIVQRDN